MENQIICDNLHRELLECSLQKAQLEVSFLQREIVTKDMEIDAKVDIMQTRKKYWNLKLKAAELEREYWSNYNSA